ncbi:hypothetical protein [Marinifilum breve]|uniref:hypothetical protein n=1 Tax=Marinifilum breve TaxID=2184082 RepID=UPI001403B943|nr:hypothetical protein [Marinifilum breve]
MGLFGKKKKNTSCCSFEIEEVKDNKKKKPASSCCDFQIEEVKDDKKSNQSNGGGCCG